MHSRHPRNRHPGRRLRRHHQHLSCGRLQQSLPRLHLLTGVEWNLVTSAQAAPAAARRFTAAFTELWHVARPLSTALITDYSNTVQRLWPDGMAFDEPSGDRVQLRPRPWQERALASLVQLRQSGCGRALAAVATGMGKTWLAALDVCQVGRQQQRRPRILVVAHRSQILAQAEAAITSLLDAEFTPATVSWYLGNQNDFSGDLVIASIQKLCRPTGLALLEATRFDYAILDEVHHAQAPTCAVCSPASRPASCSDSPPLPNAPTVSMWPHSSMTTSPASHPSAMASKKSPSCRSTTSASPTPSNTHKSHGGAVDLTPRNSNVPS
ncbi:MAG UNVERIFIED_CONTAM: DEAD/DEAH box helicase family protein [Planctomycetaceae bacterium]